VDWLSYSPSDFLLFSAEVYWRLFELENAALWPLPALASPALFLALAFMAARPRIGRRLLAILLSLVWLSVGWHFLWQRYQPINWAVAYAAPAFWAQAALWGLVAFGPVRAPAPLAGLRGWAGAALALAALAAYPLLAPLAGRPLSAAEIAGIAPDPTAVFGAGAAVLAVPSRRRWLLLIVPVLWLLASAATLLTLGSAQGWLVLAAAIVILAVAATPAARPRR